MQKYEEGHIDGQLLLSILAISSHILGVSSLWTSQSLKSCLNYLITQNSFDLDTLGDTIPLSRFQQACLLAFYQFHQAPGPRAWLRVSELTREAYHYGLHQIDNPRQCQLYNNLSMTAEETEEWRRVWWCIYCLDSYCNITSSTPFVIDLDSVRTALISSTHATQPHDSVFLPSDSRDLWETSKAVSSRPGDFQVNVHMVTTTILRKAGKLVNLWRLNPTPQIDASFKALDDHLSAVRLALPSRYLDVSRNIVMNESLAEHHARLICVLHLHATRLMINIPRNFDVGEESWRQAWQAVLESCEDVVSIVKQWKAQLCSSVDPAICFIITGVLMVLHLHSIDAVNSDSVEFLARLRGHKDLLRLFVEQFASIWHLPRFLIGKYLTCKT
ncbi:putative fungal-specific transcription factor [Hyaloscypha variabilis F]|uniref:Putative fungal-specific transcription factor n=1 Tax=Hyaloscypha variabilis (strain UAMH 11265 / GT02V1 / F) TaxID=1149755 RepID=A0A2J6S848_HYAVF|nr:putative fungal-specific transcription factor [Hyaloscypha variabilis F]